MVAIGEIVLETRNFALLLNEDELELLHNLLSAGPKLGHSTFRKVAGDLIEAFDEIRGELLHEDRLFDYCTHPQGDGEDDLECEGLEWHREEPYPYVYVA